MRAADGTGTATTGTRAAPEPDVGSVADIGEERSGRTSARPGARRRLEPASRTSWSTGSAASIHSVSSTSSRPPGASPPAQRWICAAGSGRCASTRHGEHHIRGHGRERQLGDVVTHEPQRRELRRRRRDERRRPVSPTASAAPAASATSAVLYPGPHPRSTASPGRGPTPARSRADDDAASTSLSSRRRTAAGSPSPNVYRPPAASLGHTAGLLVAAALGRDATGPAASPGRFPPRHATRTVRSFRT